MSAYHQCVPQFIRMLGNIEHWLDKAEAQAAAGGKAVAALLHERLAPDQRDFMRQVQDACDLAKFTAARLCGREPPEHPNTETTVVELRTRIRTCIAHLRTYRPEDFVDAEERDIRLTFVPGRWKRMRGFDFLHEFELPNFYFHATTAYDILRHNGVPLGKRDYLGPIRLSNVEADTVAVSS